MSYLLDTHAFLWSIFDSKKLSKIAANTFLDPENTIHVSLISFWEISIKYSLGKISLKNITPEELPSIALSSGIEIFNLNPSDVSSFYKLPKIHNKDPFDRLIIWQSIRNDFILISKDSKMKQYKNYGLKVIW